MLAQISTDSATKSFIVWTAFGGQFVLTERELTAGGEDVVVQLVTCLLLRVIAL
jgi:hypothetical protein